MSATWLAGRCRLPKCTCANGTLADESVLIRGFYPPVAVRPDDWPTYIATLQQAQAGQGVEAFDRFLYERLHATLGEYLSASRQALPAPKGTSL
jgi:hypothetical protein